MIATLLALQATVTEALPADVSNAATQTLAQATTGGGINYLELMAKASLPVKIIVLALLVGSFVSWVIIFRKARIFKQATREADEFENRFWSGADLGKLYSSATDRRRNVGGLEAIFEAGFREYTRLRDKRRLDGRAQLEGAQRAMRTTGHAGASQHLKLTSRLTKASDTLEAMLQKHDRGLVVIELMGQGVNYVTGDYSRGAAGFWVENGRIAYPVHEITIAGNLRDMFKRITAVGADTYTMGTKTIGSVLIERMKIAGL